MSDRSSRDADPAGPDRAARIASAAGPAPDNRGSGWLGSHTTAATLALVATTAVWGGTFVVVQDSVGRMPVLPFLFWRFALAALALWLVRPRGVLTLDPARRRHGLILGLMLGTGYVLQTFGLQHTTAAASGFITGMFVVFTPLLSWLALGQSPSKAVWIGGVLALAGLGLISLDGLSMGLGDLLTLGAALAFAGHIVGLGQWSTPQDAHAMTVLQLAVVALMCLAMTPLQGGLVLPPDARVWAAIAFLALAATALAFLAQTWAQSHMPAARAAIVLTLEPVFAGAFAVTVGGDRITARLVAGGLCILAAMYVVELAPRMRRTDPADLVSPPR